MLVSKTHDNHLNCAPCEAEIASAIWSKTLEGLILRCFALRLFSLCRWGYRCEREEGNTSAGKRAGGVAREHIAVRALALGTLAERMSKSCATDCRLTPSLTLSSQGYQLVHVAAHRSSRRYDLACLSRPFKRTDHRRLDYRSGVSIEFLNLRTFLCILLLHKGETAGADVIGA